jgi:hypothetical protein
MIKEPAYRWTYSFISTDQVLTSDISRLFSISQNTGFLQPNGRNRILVI